VIKGCALDLDDSWITMLGIALLETVMVSTESPLVCFGAT